MICRFMKICLASLMTSVAATASKGSTNEFEADIEGLNGLLDATNHVENEIIELVISKHMDSFSLIELDLENMMYMKPRSRCVKNALKDLIPECLKLGMDSIEPGVQKKLAILLSICEFENSKVKYPSSCSDMRSENDYDNCIIDIERAPQFWTTFSGYYRDIAKICFEESLPFEKEQIIALYSNITNLYGKMFQDLNNSYKDSNNIKNSMKKEFEELLTIMKVIISQNEKTKTEMKESYEEFSKQYNSMLLQSLQISKNFSLDTEILVEDMARNIKYFDFELSKISFELNDLQFDKKLESMKGMVLDDIKNLSDESIVYLDNILANLESLDVIAKENQRHTRNISSSLRENEYLSKNVYNSLIETDLQLQEHNDIIKFEFEETISFLSEFGEKAIDNAIRDTSDEITKHVSMFIDGISLRLEETTTKLDEVIENVDNLSDKVGNASSHLMEGLKLLTNNGFMDTIALSYSKVSTCVASGFGLFTILKSGMNKVLHFLTICFLSIAFMGWSIHNFRFLNQMKYLKVSQVKILRMSYLSRVFRFLANIALWISIMGGTLLAIIVTNFIIQLKLYISSLPTIE